MKVSQRRESRIDYAPTPGQILTTYGKRPATANIVGRGALLATLVAQVILTVTLALRGLVIFAIVAGGSAFGFWLALSPLLAGARANERLLALSILTVLALTVGSFVGTFAVVHVYGLLLRRLFRVRPPRSPDRISTSNM
jgi:hypothetical protein